MYVDKFARQCNCNPEYTLQIFYGQLQHLFVIQFESACPRLELNVPTVILTAIRTCVIEDSNTLLVQALDIHDYMKEGALHVVEVTSVQCLVGRVKDKTEWSILDQSGGLARAISADDEADI